MGTEHSKNYMGMTLTDEEFNKIPYPRSELTSHVTDKCFQAGCLLGTVFGTGHALVRSSTRNMTGVLSKVNKYGVRLALFGCFIGPVMTYARIKNLEDDAVKDRCYRLRHNRNQVRVDMAANAGLCVGPITALIMGQMSLKPMLTGVVLGVTGGVVGAAVFNANIAKK